jgi:lysophospholipase L1-like esterase
MRTAAFQVTVLLFLALVSGPAICQEATSPVAPSGEALVERFREQAVKSWEKEVQKYEQQDRSEPDPESAILLLGSSSIRLWKTAAEDLSPYPVISRGYGGAKYSDLAVYAERLVKPHKFRAAVIFVGNDVVGGKDDRTPEEVAELARFIVQTIRRHNAEAPVFLIEITPTPKRFAVWEEIRQVNARLRELSFLETNTFFIETAEAYLTRDNLPRPEFFGDDKLHQNQTGYKLWGKLIRSELDQVLAH